MTAHAVVPDGRENGLAISVPLIRLVSQPLLLGFSQGTFEILTRKALAPYDRVPRTVLFAPVFGFTISWTPDSTPNFMAQRPASFILFASAGVLS